MKNILKSLVIVVAVAAVAGVATYSYFSDTETSTGNTFSAGSIDLTVDDANGETIGAKFSAQGMKPGKEYNGGCVTLKNEGSLDGVLTLKVKNPVSNENTTTEPELSSGDVDGTEVDPTGYDKNGGDGELWDEIATEFCIDSASGSYANGKCETGIGGEKVFYSNYGTPGNDSTSSYNLPLDADLADGDNVLIGAGQSVKFCTDVFFIEDTSNWWWGSQGSLKNNMAMTDDAQFDVEFGLKQVTP